MRRHRHLHSRRRLPPSRTPIPFPFANLLAKVTCPGRRTCSTRSASVASDVVAYVLPHLAETHLALWEAEAAGIAMAINPALPGEQIADLGYVLPAHVCW